MNKKQTHCIIAGGGIVGIVAAILLTDKYDQVTVIEKGKQLGGLLASYKDDQGAYFDFGTHIPTTVGIAELDELLFGPEAERSKDWIIHQSSDSASYFNGQWNKTSGLIDARALPQEKYEQGLIEFLHLTEESVDEKTLERYLLKTFGSVFTNEIYKPVAQKLYAKKLSDLDPSSLPFFVLNRLIMLNSEVSNKLKQIDFFDKKIGFHTAKPSISFYPRDKKGCGIWIDTLVKKAKNKGVLFRTETAIEEIQIEGKKVQTVKFTSEEALPCDLLVWTVPPFLAYKAARLKYEFKPPTLRTTTLFHLGFDKKFKIQDALYLWIFDPNFKSFRVTLYPNLNPDKNKEVYTLTAEILSTSEEAEGFQINNIVEELRNLKVVANDAKLLNQTKLILRNTFPVVEVGFRDTVSEIYEDLSGKVSNLLLLGRSTGKAWFMTDTLRQTYEVISEMEETQLNTYQKAGI